MDHKVVTRAVSAFRLGLRDGWEQPRELTSTTSVWHLIDDGASEDAALTWQDRGANLGQFARAGIGSESWREGFWPFFWRTPDLSTDPRCDVCGTHMEEVPTWCGKCGNCREHCALTAH